MWQLGAEQMIDAPPDQSRRVAPRIRRVLGSFEEM
jgi:hypothetical protein